MKAAKKMKTERTAQRAPRRNKKAEVHALPKPEAQPARGSVVPASFKAKAGKAGIMNGDDLGTAIKNAFLAAGSNDLTPAQSARIACDELLQENGLDVGRWEGRNPGMLRMNISNVLRGIRRNGESVTIRGKSFKAA